MSLLGNIFSALFGNTAVTATAPDAGQSAERMAEWEAALQNNALPSCVAARLDAVANGKAPYRGPSRGLDPRVHVFCLGLREKTWMAGSSPAMGW